jgi:lipopolysaccharide export system permease protein
MPSFLIITMPISFLIAILIGIGRLSSDNEITVLKASGCGLQRLLRPIGVAALTVFLLTAMTGVFAPLSNRAMKGLLFEIVQQRASIGIKEKVFNDDFKDLVLYTEKIDPRGDFMEGILVSDQRLAREPATIIAKKGVLVSNPRAMTVTLRLTDGSIHTVDSGKKNYRKTGFSTYDVNLDLKTVAAGQGAEIKKGSVDMTFGELLENIRKPGFQEHERRDMIIELNKKFSIPISCFVFGLLALPFAIVNRRSGKSKGFTVGMLIVVFYYTLQLAGEALGETGRISPVAAVWAPNLILGATGIYMFIRAVQEKPYLPFALPAFIGGKKG